MFEIRLRDVPEQLVLTERQQHVRQPELPDRLRSAMGRVYTASEDHGGPVGLCFTVFPDEDHDENDITFEFCAPIKPEDGSAVPGTRREPAHREAYVRLRKAQTEWPQIGSAYSAVVEWIGAQGLTIAAAPREVYFADYQSAGPDDEVFDVAFPVR